MIHNFLHEQAPASGPKWTQKNVLRGHEGGRDSVPASLEKKRHSKRKHRANEARTLGRSASAPPAALLRTVIHKYAAKIRGRIEQIKELASTTADGSSAPAVGSELDKLLQWLCKKASQSRSLAVFELGSAFPHDIRVMSDMRSIALINEEPMKRSFESALPRVHQRSTPPPLSPTQEVLKPWQPMVPPGLTLPPVAPARRSGESMNHAKLGSPLIKLR